MTDRRSFLVRVAAFFGALVARCTVDPMPLAAATPEAEPFVFAGGPLDSVAHLCKRCGAGLIVVCEEPPAGISAFSDPGYIPVAPGPRYRDACPECDFFTADLDGRSVRFLRAEFVHGHRRLPPGVQIGFASHDTFRRFVRSLSP